jgi:hypothetical protein
MCSMILWVLACKQIVFVDTDDTATTVPDAWLDVYAVEGSLTSSLHDAGGDDCAFVTTYAATQDWSQPWTCPECEAQFVADVTVDDEACYRRVHGNLPEREYIGVAPNDTFLRATQANFPLQPVGFSSLDGDELSIDEALTSDDGSTLTVEGTLTRTPTDADPWHGFAPPNAYACGWPKADPPTYDGPWEYHVNQTIPDGWFKDTCDESVRLHDLAGGYLVIDVSAVDCAPCQLMASKEAAFTSAFAKEGIDVKSVTLLAPSLSAILDDTPIETLETWKKTYGVSGLVLADRGWGYAIPEKFLGAKNYPTWTVISPDLRAIAIGSGFESYQLIENAIRADLE